MSSTNYTDQSALPAADGLEVVDNSYPEAVDGYRKHADPGYGGYGGYAVTPAPSPPAVAAAEKQVAVVAPGEKRICGLRRSTLILLVVLAVVIVGAAVGGGVGGSMAVSDAYDRGYADAEAEALLSSPSNPDSDSNSGTDSSTDSDTDSGTNSTDSTDDTSVQNGRISSPPTTGKLLLDCPGLDGTIQTVTPQSKTYKFQAICGADSAPGEGSKNIAAIVAYRLSDCLRACASMNERDNVGKDNRCGAVHWHVDLAFVQSHGGNCWLKKGYDKLVGDVDGDSADLHVFATLEGEK